MEKEIWKDVAGYEGLYKISNMGNFYCYPKQWKITNGGYVKKKECYPQPTMNRNGYYHIIMSKNNKRKHEYIHKLVTIAFIGEIPKGMVCNHIDHNRTNNKAENLEICTQIENIKKSVKNCSRKLKLSKQDLEKIIELNNSGRSIAKLAIDYNMSRIHLGKILNNKIISYDRYL